LEPAKTFRLGDATEVNHRPLPAVKFIAIKSSRIRITGPTLVSAGGGVAPARAKHRTAIETVSETGARRERVASGSAVLIVVIVVVREVVREDTSTRLWAAREPDHGVRWWRAATCHELRGGH
jgi:hypothetical protein